MGPTGRISYGVQAPFRNVATAMVGARTVPNAGREAGVDWGDCVMGRARSAPRMDGMLPRLRAMAISFDHFCVAQMKRPLQHVYDLGCVTFVPGPKAVPHARLRPHVLLALRAF